MSGFAHGLFVATCATPGIMWQWTSAGIQSAEEARLEDPSDAHEQAEDDQGAGKPPAGPPEA